jgi:hypothetical protein
VLLSGDLKHQTPLIPMTSKPNPILKSDSSRTESGQTKKGGSKLTFSHPFRPQPADNKHDNTGSGGATGGAKQSKSGGGAKSGRSQKKSSDFLP